MRVMRLCKYVDDAIKAIKVKLAYEIGLMGSAIKVKEKCIRKQ